MIKPFFIVIFFVLFLVEIIIDKKLLKPMVNSIVSTNKYKEANMTQKNKMLSAAAKKWIKNPPKQLLTMLWGFQITHKFVCELEKFQDILFDNISTNNFSIISSMKIFV